MIAEDPSTAAPSAPLTTVERLQTVLGWVIRWTRSWSFVGVVFVAYVLIGLRALSDDRYLNDEGLLTYLYAEFLHRDFVATFFWLKSHPALALLNLPGAMLGLGGFFVLHVFLGALGLVFIAIAARRAGIREVGLAPLVLATSPIYVQGGASGIANVDGVAMASAALALCLASAPGFLAGLVAGVLPFVRFELGLVTVSLVVIALATPRRWRFLIGLACLPLAYLGAGAVYHGTPTWCIAFPPAWGQWDPKAFTVVAEGVELITAGTLVRSVGLTLPALPLLLVVRWSRATPRRVHVTLAVYVLAFVAAITLLPFARVAFGFDARYYLTALPAVALLVARAADSFGEPDTWSTGGRLLRVLLAAACAAGAVAAGAWGLAATSLVATIILAVSIVLGSGARLTAAPAVVAVSALLPLVCAVTLPPGYRGRGDLETATAWLRDHRTELGHVPIYTNLKLLSAFASRSGRAPDFDIVGLIQPDMRRELFAWSNPANGQRERIWRLAHEVFYGRGAEPEDILTGRAPPGAVLVLNLDDLRTNEMFPPSFLATHTETRVRSQWLLIAVLRPRETG